MITLKVAKTQGFNHSLEDTFFETPQGGGIQNDAPSRFRVKASRLKLG